MGASLPAVNLGTGAQAISLSAGKYHTCALLVDLSVKCWGFNAYGQLATGDAANRGDQAGSMGDHTPVIDLNGKKVLQLVSGGNFNCAIVEDQSQRCWGENDHGELLLGDTTNRGDAPGEMGASLPPTAVGTGKTVLDVTAGKYHACAILNDQCVKCWGIAGMLGAGDASMRGDAPTTSGDNLAPIDLGTGRTGRLVRAGAYQTCALLDNQALKCRGENASGTLGIGTATPATVGNAAGQMGDALAAINVGTGLTVVDLTSGGHNGYADTCAILSNGAFKCWGYNTVGELGLGDMVTRSDTGSSMGDNLPAVALGTGRHVVEFAAGGHTLCCITARS